MNQSHASAAPTPGKAPHVEEADPDLVAPLRASEGFLALLAERAAARQTIARIDGPGRRLEKANDRVDAWMAAHPRTAVDERLAEVGMARPADPELVALLSEVEAALAEGRAAHDAHERCDSLLHSAAQEEGRRLSVARRPRIAAVVREYRDALHRAIQGAEALRGLHNEAAGLGGIPAAEVLLDAPHPDPAVVAALVGEIRALHGRREGGQDKPVLDIGPLPALPVIRAAGF